MTDPDVVSRGDASVPGIVEGVADTEAILRRALDELDLQEQHGDFLEPRFEDILVSLMEKGHELLQLEQTDPIRKLCKDFLDTDPKNPSRATERFLRGIASITNQTKKRAGIHMMRSMEWILRRCNIPCESGYSVTKRNDLVCPSLDAYRRFPESSVRIEFKRTLRERGQQLSRERSDSPARIWLLTLDSQLTAGMIDRLGGNNLTLYVTQNSFAKVAPDARSRVMSMRTILADLRSVIGSNPQGRLVVE
jgi:hypothetical protein